MSHLQAYGQLSVTPELEWDDFKKTKYLPHEYWSMVGRNSAFSSNCSLLIRDRLAEDGGSFIKYCTGVKVNSSSMTGSVRALLHDIQELIETFPDHRFEGTVMLTHGEAVHGKIVVREGEAIWLDPMQVWVPHSEPAQPSVISRWVPNRGWVDDDLTVRLGMANALLDVLLNTTMRVARDDEHAAAHQEGERCQDEACILTLTEEHLRRETPIL